MKYLSFCLALLLYGIPALWAKENTPQRLGQYFTWGLLWKGSWELSTDLQSEDFKVESKNLINRGEVRFGFPVPGLTLRGQALDKRPFDFESSPPWGDGSKVASDFSGALYHKPTGSRLLYGILDEWGLSARIRSPWIRAVPFAENHKPLMADLKTVTSATKEPEVYLYLSSPWLRPFSNTGFRGFAAAQTKTQKFLPDFSGGIEAKFGKKTNALLEGFYTNSELPARKSTSWFSDPPPLPEREFRLYALGLLVSSPIITFSSDWAYSETFAYGRDIYGNAGLRAVLPFPKLGKNPGVWSVSLAGDGGGSRYTGRDGTNPGAGFRAGGKIERKGSGTSLFRFSTTLRSPGFGEDFTRSSSTLYYRFPVLSKKKNTDKKPFPLRITRVSFGADRNASDQSKINDSISGTLGLSLSLLPLRIKTPLGINFSGSLKGINFSDDTPPPYPIPQNPYDFDSAKVSGELLWSPGLFQFKTKWGYEVTAKKEGWWDASFSTAVRFKYGRFSVRFSSPKLWDKWDCTLSWTLEKK